MIAFKILINGVDNAPGSAAAKNECIGIERMDQPFFRSIFCEINASGCRTFGGTDKDFFRIARRIAFVYDPDILSANHFEVGCKLGRGCFFKTSRLLRQNDDRKICSRNSTDDEKRHQPQK